MSVDPIIARAQQALAASLAASLREAYYAGRGDAAMSLKDKVLALIDELTAPPPSHEVAAAPPPPREIAAAAPPTRRRARRRGKPSTRRCITKVRLRRRSTCLSRMRSREATKLRSTPADALRGECEIFQFLRLNPAANTTASAIHEAIISEPPIGAA